jgi:hypothetical protein
MVTEFPFAVFAKVDYDGNQETAAHCGVLALPTFQLYKEGKKVAETKGANEQLLRVTVFATIIMQSFVFHCYLSFVAIWLPFAKAIVTRITSTCAGHDTEQL